MNDIRFRTYSTFVVALVLVLVAESELFKYTLYSDSVASSVWALALAFISLLLETEQTEPHLEVVLKSTQFW